MIVSYRDKRTRDFAGGKRGKAFSGIERSARLKLDRLEAATALKDLAVLPGNRFEALGPSIVEIVDYHLGVTTWRWPQYIQGNTWPKN
jgi:plasmid maintenance system killer protein